MKSENQLHLLMGGKKSAHAKKWDKSMLGCKQVYMGLIPYDICEKTK